MPCEPQTLGSVGVFTSMLVENSDTTDPCDVAVFDSSSERYEILSENITYTDVLLGGNGLTGTIDRTGIHTRHGARVVTGQFTLEVGPYELANWLPRIFGNNATSPYETQETFDLLPFDIMLKRDQGTVIYRHCGVRSAVFNAAASVGGSEQVLRLTIEILGFEEHNATYPVAPPDLPSTDRLYWLIGDGQLQLTPSGGSQTEYYFDSFSLRIDNGLTPILRNFLNVTALQSRGREIMFRASTPYTAGSHTALYIDYFKGTGTLSFLSSKSSETPASYSTVITLNDLRSTRRTPNAGGPGEIPLFIDMKAHRSGTNEPISVVNAT
jgi:hypothetical protein